MDVLEMLDAVRRQALRDNKIKEALLATREAADPLNEFCRNCQSLGYELYPMDIVNAGEEFYASMRRSTNGGGENSPLLEGQDDYYELFLAGLN